jgi:T5SS/PEP-CTERM-associated repeat protein
MPKTSLLQWSSESGVVGVWDGADPAWGDFSGALAINGDLWNVSPSSVGSVTMLWDATDGSITTDVDFSSVSGVSSGNPTLGYPNIQYGQSPFGGPNTSVAAFQLPAQISAIQQQSSLELYADYSIQNPNAVQLDFAYDTFLTTDQPTGSSAGPTTLGPSMELMIWLDEQNGIAPAGTEITSFSLPTLVNGQLEDSTWNVYVGSGGSGSLVTFALANPPSPNSGASVGVYLGSVLADLESSTIIDAINSQNASTWTPAQVAALYVDSIYLGSEFFKTSTSEIYSWTLNSLDVLSAPTVVAGSTATYTSGGAAVDVDPGLLFSYAAEPSLAGATISITSGLLTGDTLDFTNQNGIVGTYASGVLTLTGTATVAAYQAALGSVTYGSTSTDATSGGADTSRTITWTVNDEDATSAPVTSTIDVLSPPPVPTIAAPTAATIGAGQSGPISGVSLSEDGSTTGESFTVTLADSNGDLSASGTGVSGAGTTHLTITGSLSQVNAALATLADTEGTTPSDTITLNATDSLGNAATTKTIAVTVNGDPVIDSLTAIVGVNRSSAITGISLSESGNTTGETFMVTLVDNHGDLSATGMGVSGSGTAKAAITGSLGQVNATLATLTDTDGTTPSDTITLNATDSLGNSAIAEQIAGTVNGDPVITLPSTASIKAGQATSIAGVSLAESGTTAGENFSATLTDTNGELSVSPGSGASISGSGTTSLTVVGSLSQVNAALTTLADTEATTLSDTITLIARDSFGNTAGTKTIALTVAATPSSGNLIVGNGATGTLLVEGIGTTQSVLNTAIAQLGLTANGVGNVTVNDAVWSNSANASIGEYGVGTLNVGDDGVVNFVGGVSLGQFAGSTGQVNIASGGAVHEAQTLWVGYDEYSPAGTATVAVASGGSLTVNYAIYIGSGSQIDLTGGTVAGGAVGVTIGNLPGGLISGYGTLAVPDGEAVVNDGTIRASGGNLQINESVIGTGAIQIAANSMATITGSSLKAAGIAFTGPDATLSLAHGANVAAPISGFAIGDIIAMANVTDATFTASTGMLVLTDNGVNVDSLHFLGSFAGDTFGVQQTVSDALITLQHS